VYSALVVFNEIMLIQSFVKIGKRM